jgi:hypothetical protein
MKLTWAWCHRARWHARVRRAPSLSLTKLSLWPTSEQPVLLSSPTSAPPQISPAPTTAHRCCCARLATLLLAASAPSRPRAVYESFPHINISESMPNRECNFHQIFSNGSIVSENRHRTGQIILINYTRFTLCLERAFSIIFIGCMALVTNNHTFYPDL